ncbi:ABC transporter ATP-binding protein, partial [Paenibacillus wenxiniae]
MTVLEDYLEEFPGVVLAVSHDRYFLDRTCEKIFALEGGGVVSIHAGNYSEYEERTGGQSMKSGLAAEGKGAAQPKAASSTPAANSNVGVDASESAGEANKRSSSRDKLKFSYKEQREYEQIDSMIEAAEQ